MFLHSWLLFPLVLLMLCVGCGHLLSSIAGGLDRLLIVPCGCATAVVIVSALTYLDQTAELAAPVLAAAALAGLGLAAREHLGRRRTITVHRGWWWPAMAGGLAFLAVGAPVLMTGHAGFTGYARIVDIAYQLDLTSHLITRGRHIGPVDSAATQVVSNILSVGYPTGSQALLGTSSWLVGINPIWSWQPFLGGLMAVLALSLYAMLRHAIEWSPLRSLAAAVAAQPTILFAYTITGGIKELAAAAMLALLGAVLVTGSDPALAAWRRALPPLVVLVAGLAVFNVGFVPWAGVLMLLVVGPGLARWHPSRPPLPTALAIVALLIVVAVPLAVTLPDLLPLLREGGPTQAGSELGNLATPVPTWSVFGPWITQDYRFALSLGGQEGLTQILAVATAVLVALGLARSVLRRDRILLAMACAGAAGLAVVVWRGNEWIDLKAACVTAPLVVAMAFTGMPLLRRRGATIAGLLLAGAVLAGNAKHYQATTLAPTARLADLEHIADRQGTAERTLMTTWEEYGEYLLRERRGVSLASTPSDPTFYLTAEGTKRPGFARDMDEMNPEFVAKFDTLVLRRDATASRPGSDFRLAERTPFYDVWRRIPGRKVLLHLPYSTVSPRRTRASCEALARQAREAAPGSRIAYASAPSGLVLVPPDAQLPAGWLRDENIRLARGPGRIAISTTIARAQRWRVSIAGSMGRRVHVAVDGREIGAVRWRESYPGQYEPVGEVTLQAGRHRFEIVRGGGSLLPGTGNDLVDDGFTTRIGPLVLEPVAARAATTHLVTPAAGGAVCRSSRPLDWMEVVAPDAPAGP